MIISGERSKRTQCGECWLPLTIRRAFTVHSGCTYVVSNARPRVGRVFAVEKHFFLAHLFLSRFLLSDPRLRSFSLTLSLSSLPPVRYFFHQNATILVLFPFSLVPSFFLLCAVHRAAEKLLKRWYPPLCAALPSLPSFSTQNSSLVIFNNVYSKLC